MNHEKIIHLATEKAKQIKRKNQESQAFAIENVLTMFHQVVMCPNNFLQFIINNLAPYVKMEFLDVDGFRGFLIDVINCIDNDDEKLQKWIDDHIIDCDKDPIADEYLFFLEPRTKEELFSETVYYIITHPGGRDKIVEFSAGVLWVLSGNYSYRKQIDIDGFITGAITANYDYEAEYNQKLNNSSFLCPAWFVPRMMNDNWFFAAIMSGGEMIEFGNLNEIADNDGLCAYIDADSISSITEKDVKEYSKKIITKNQMSIKVKNIVSRNAADGSVWMDAEIAKENAYNIWRTNVSINSRHISCSRESTEEEGVTILDFDIQSLTMKKDYGEVLRLCDAVMFFETADT